MSDSIYQASHIKRRRAIEVHLPNHELKVLQTVKAEEREPLPLFLAA